LAAYKINELASPNNVDNTIVRAGPERTLTLLVTMAGDASAVPTDANITPLAAKAAALNLKLIYYPLRPEH
jgi:hypothetical protein